MSINENPVMTRLLISFESKEEYHQIANKLNQVFLPAIAESHLYGLFDKSMVEQLYFFDYNPKGSKGKDDETNHYLFGFEITGSVDLDNALLFMDSSVIPIFETPDICINYGIKVDRFYEENLYFERVRTNNTYNVKIWK